MNLSRELFLSCLISNMLWWSVVSQEKSKVSFLMVDSAGTEDKPLKIPKEVWLMVNHLFTKSCQQVRERKAIGHIQSTNKDEYLPDPYCAL